MRLLPVRLWIRECCILSSASLLTFLISASGQEGYASNTATPRPKPKPVARSASKIVNDAFGSRPAVPSPSKAAPVPKKVVADEACVIHPTPPSRGSASANAKAKGRASTKKMYGIFWCLYMWDVYLPCCSTARPDDDAGEDVELVGYVQLSPTSCVYIDARV